MGRKPLSWKDLHWWQGEQRQRKGARHAGRFNPALDVERHVVKIAGVDWKQRAQDREWWQNQTAVYIQHFDVPWASSKQSQLENLKPNSAEGQQIQSIETK